MITVGQIKAARMMLNLKQVDLAKKAGVSIATLNNIERGAQTDPKISTLKAIQGALEKEGIEFTNDALGGIGINLKLKQNGVNGATILMVDDNKTDRALYKKWLGRLPNNKYRIVEAENARNGFDAFMKSRPQCVILDFMMYGADGFQLLAALRRDHNELPPIIFVTGMYNAVLHETAKSQGVFSCLSKQKLTAESFCQTVEQALRQ